ncbi:hypothetical protein CLV46_3174 [Diaminobutyricimonas aerilata]|uniref:OLD protein-like TOPRIM domain-containing protein n=1 Tax=Diaminobutyricimonas aerilata TaxID=1162967 RepID=A0A2M9CNV3_9MICO|nr:TOPRIM nucleotidyl transferase/hydrolase domain-containing protein [Diaminobutyricimonas aerilata]PJJ73581.1 hypothetical protein CLV46_3174 [Diaminobutyricimonas aerilata]
MGASSRARTVVLVEGESDRLALAAAARRLGVDLGASSVEVLSMRGITNLRAHLLAHAAGPDRTRILGLYDTNEVGQVVRALAAVGMLRTVPVDPAALESLGFYGCVGDLEDEVIRAAGSAEVERSLAASGDLAKFRTFQSQPAQRERTIEAQLHRFAGTASGRKAGFAVDIILRIPAERMPGPLVRLIADAVGEPS